jgi:hypothetical protein
MACCCPARPHCLRRSEAQTPCDTAQSTKARAPRLVTLDQHLQATRTYRPTTFITRQTASCCAGGTSKGSSPANPTCPQHLHVFHDSASHVYLLCRTTTTGPSLGVRLRPIWAACTTPFPSECTAVIRTDASVRMTAVHSLGNGVVHPCSP